MFVNLLQKMSLGKCNCILWRVHKSNTVNILMKDEHTNHQRSIAISFRAQHLHRTQSSQDDVAYNRPYYLLRFFTIVFPQQYELEVPDTVYVVLNPIFSSYHAQWHSPAIMETSYNQRSLNIPANICKIILWIHDIWTYLTNR